MKKLIAGAAGAALAFYGVVVADAVLPPARIQSVTGDVLSSLGFKYGARLGTTAEMTAYRWGGIVTRDGFSAAGDGGQATYLHKVGACTIAGGDGGSQIPAADGGCWVVDWTSVGGVARPEMFGGALGVAITAEGNSAQPDAQPAIQAAVNTGRAVELGALVYRVNRAIKLKTPGQLVAGAGTFATRIEFFPGFDTAGGTALGIFTHDATAFNGTGQEGPHYRDFMIKGFQPEVNTALNDTQQFAQLIQVSCIDARNTITTRFERLILSTCLRGIDMRGNSGQVVIDDLKGSNFVADIDIDGALDTVRIAKHHNYPFGMTANQAALAKRNARAIHAGRADDLKVTDSMCIQSAVCVHAFVGTPKTLVADGYDSPGGATVGSFVNYNFDIVPLGVQVDAGVLMFQGGYFASTLGGSTTAVS